MNLSIGTVYAENKTCKKSKSVELSFILNIIRHFVNDSY